MFFVCKFWTSLVQICIHELNILTTVQCYTWRKNYVFDLAWSWAFLKMWIIYKVSNWDQVWVYDGLWYTWSWGLGHLIPDRKKTKSSGMIGLCYKIFNFPSFIPNECKPHLDNSTFFHVLLVFLIWENKTDFIKTLLRHRYFQFGSPALYCI